jgi:hypothetical protein
MRPTKRARQEESEGTAAFSSIPMEKLSGLDETLWLDQISSKTTKQSFKKAKENKRNTRQTNKKGSRLNI